ERHGARDEPNPEAVIVRDVVEHRRRAVRISLDAGVAPQELAERLPQRERLVEVRRCCTVMPLCETMEDEPVLQRPRVGELLLAGLEIGGVDEGENELQRPHNLCYRN